MVWKLSMNSGEWKSGKAEKNEIQKNLSGVQKERLVWNSVWKKMLSVYGKIFRRIK